MKNKSLKFKIFLLFSFPLIVFLYFSYLYVQTKYREFNDVIVFQLSTKISNSMNNLVYNLQIERGLSAGYIVRKNTTLNNKKLLAQYKKTDRAYANFFSIVNSNSEDKKRLRKLIAFKAEPPMLRVLENLENLQLIRTRVLDANISFKEEMHYYTNINKELILIIKIFNTLFKNMQGDSIAIIKLLELKEAAGLERAYIYSNLLSESKESDISFRLKELQNQQEKLLKEYFVNASSNSIRLYNKYNDKETLNALKLCRQGISNNTLSNDAADRCFEVSTNYIDIFNNISIQMLQAYKNKTTSIYENSLNSLYVTILLWIITMIAIYLLAYFLIKLITNEEKNTQELRIASYAFNAQEAITITNLEGVIIKVNDAFTKITGYEPEEVIGKNPNFLKSKLHDANFYKTMWAELLKFDSWQGEIYNQRKNGEIYPEMLSITAIKDDNNVTTHYIGQFLDISEIKEAKEIAQYQANHDFLTDLLNRKSLIERLNQEFIKAQRHKLVHAFLFIDLDHFKSINDSYGHDVGDKLIIETAKRLKSVLRTEDIAARISGDEFGVVVVNLGENESQAAKAVKQICTKILQEISKEFTINKQVLQISSSIGIKIFPDNEHNIQDIMIHADKAMYEAKKQGKNRFIFFNTEIENELKRFTTLEKEIKESIADNDFVFFYQPCVSTNTGKIVGAELLVRWHHKTRGLLYPDSFIEIAEEIGIIHKFTILALQSACHFIKSNKNFDGTLAINISSQELLHPNFAKQIISLINNCGVDPKQIELEITESMIIEKFDLTIKKILKLQEFGIQFSIDDFGTGYSSITYLQKLPANTLKIDRSFIQNLEDGSNKELVKMIANIAKTFKMKIIAEGIETTTQLEFIKNLNVESYQGYYFSKPIDEESFKKLL